MKPVMPRLDNLVAATRKKVKGECCLVEQSSRTLSMPACEEEQAKADVGLQGAPEGNGLHFLSNGRTLDWYDLQILQK